jgi:hypothetical protein
MIFFLFAVLAFRVAQGDFAGGDGGFCGNHGGEELFGHNGKGQTVDVGLGLAGDLGDLLELLEGEVVES